MRKTLDVTISMEGRDHGKVFFLEEMPASQAERWATRALLVLVNAGVNLPDGIGKTGIAGVAIAGFDALRRVDIETTLGLLDEMMTCVKIRPSPKENWALVRDLIESDIFEVATRLQLKQEVFTLHTGFSWADLKSKLTSTTTSAAS